MATKKQTTEQSNEPVRALVLRACQFGEPGEIVTVSQADAVECAAQGMFDTAPEAVSAAEGV